MGAPAPNQTMAISPYMNDAYDGQRYYAEQERRYREQMERQRMYMAQQQQAYDPYRQMQGQITDQQIQEGQKPKPMPTPEYLKNDKLLLLEN